MLTKSAVAIAGFFFALFVLALAFGNVILLIAALTLLLSLTLALLLAPPGGISVRRDIARSTVWVGDVVEVRRTVTVASGIGAIYLHDALPDEAVVEEGNNIRGLWKGLGPRTFDASYKVLLPKRGEYNLPETEWSAHDPLRMRPTHRGAGGGKLRIAVVPRLMGIQRIAQVRAKAATPYPDFDPAWTGVATTEFMDLRPYAPGDPVKSINWKASARRSTMDKPPLVNNYETEGRKAIWLFVDGARYMQVGTSLSNPLEQAVEAASGLAHFYLSRGYTLGAYVFNNPAGFLSPDVGQKQFRRLSNLLLRLQSSDVDQGLPAAVEWCKHSLFRLKPHAVIITRLDAFFSHPRTGMPSVDGLLGGVRRIVALGARGRLRIPVWVISVKGTAYAPDRNPLEGHAADLIGWETRPLARMLRRAGASVLEWDPSKDTFATVLLRHLNLTRAAR